ncbi:MAG: hypothetical protein OJF59_002859 [Cytophagales bacterium]|nr:MAG: hypothetical protein OJF59_002859 [Cytophagales bacterium]
MSFKKTAEVLYRFVLFHIGCQQAQTHLKKYRGRDGKK